MFTAENFRRIYDSENRKGLDIAGKFFPNLAPFTKSVKDITGELRSFRKTRSAISAEAFSDGLFELKKKLAKAKVEKSAAIDQELETLGKNILQSKFKITLTKRELARAKTVYIVDSKPEMYFVVKQLQYNLHKLYGIKQANRHDVVCRVRDAISSRYPYEFVRTDISNFYERIDRKTLLEKLETDQLLSAASRKFIKQILDAYGALSGSLLGIPRGVGISAYLAELYLRPIDEAISNISGVVLYCRYVDDIVAIFARPPVGKFAGSYEDALKDILSKVKLQLNKKKTASFDLKSQKRIRFEYLGYRFDLGTALQISPSARKIRKYKDRTNAAFQRYNEDRCLKPRRAFRDLVARVKFLTGNTRLVNSKASAVTGVYYSNSLATRIVSLELLDELLKKNVKKLQSKKLKDHLKEHLFTTGFKQRRFHNFGARELATIVSAWKHE